MTSARGFGLARSILAAAVATTASVACGPEGSDDTGSSGIDGDGSGTGATSGAEGSGSASASATSAGTGTSGGTTTSASASGTADGGSGEDTAGACPPSLVPVEPGCEPAPDGVPIPAAGCYVPCEVAGAPCEADGVCKTVWVNPCVCPDGDGCCGACGGEATVCMPGGATGDECTSDRDCASGVCWNFSDYDPCCFGTACSGACRTDAECQALAADAGAPTPEGASCSPDGRCSLVGTGFGSWACAGPPCG